LNQPKFALGMTTPETIIFPKGILSPIDLADSTVFFKFRFIKGNLDISAIHYKWYLKDTLISNLQ